MQRSEKEVSENVLRFQVKRPSGLNKKWALCECDVSCSECGSTDIFSSNDEGPLVVLACNECSNYDYVEERYIFKTTKDEEPYISVPDGFEKESNLSL